MVERIVYGTNASLNNIGQIAQHYDQSGQTVINSYDFKGNPLQTTKTFAVNYQTYIDWDNNPALQTEVFTTQITFDALNRPVTKTLPDGTLQAFTYNKAGLLETVTNNSTAFVTNINYNEKGQRTDIYYGNGSKTRYYYDAKTFRLTRLLTTRNTGQDVLQDLNYTYDLVGNITQQVDNAQQTFYYSNSVIAPVGKYVYDALYRLTQATGRELINLQLPTHTDFANNLAVPNTTSNAMQNYTQQYSYDELGNMQQMNSVSKWTRNYVYDTTTNRLLKHDSNQTLPDYTYDAHGNMLTMPHLQTLNWDFKDELKAVTLNAGGDTAYYVYDASGNRVRKVIVKGNIVEERYYLGDYEVYRKFVSGTLDTERTTVNVNDSPSRNGGNKKKIATIDKLTVDQGSLISSPTAVVRYQYDNHIGSASLELDENAAVISYEEYHPFGTTSYRSGRTETETSLKRYKYVGKERDEETGLYYYGARYYAAWLCRFVSVDPLQHKYPYYTPYQYAGNKPVTFIDLDGLEEASVNKVQQKPSFAKSIFRFLMGENYKNRAESFAANRNIPTSNIKDMGNSTIVVTEENKFSYLEKNGSGQIVANTLTYYRFHVFREAKVGGSAFSIGSSNDDYNLSADQLAKIRVLGYTPLSVDFGGGAALKGSTVLLSSANKLSYLQILKRTKNIINQSQSALKKIRFPVWGDDLLDKGFHLHIDDVELGLRYADENIELVNVGKKSMSLSKLTEASEFVKLAFQNPKWRNELFLELIKMRDNTAELIEAGKQSGRINRNAENTLTQLNNIINKIGSIGGN